MKELREKSAAEVMQIAFGETEKEQTMSEQDQNQITGTPVRTEYVTDHDYPPNSLRDAVEHLAGLKNISGESMTDQDLQYFAYSIELFSELTSGMATILRHPDRAKGTVALLATQLACSLRCENFKPLTEWERKLALDSIRLYLYVKDAIEGRDPELVHLKRIMSEFDTNKQ